MYIDAVIDAAKDWLTTPSRLSPFDVVEPILAVEGSDEVSSDMTLTFYSFGIDPVSVRPVRQRVVDLAFMQAESSDIPSAVRAIKDAHSGHPRSDRPCSTGKSADSERERWAARVLADH